MKFIFKKYIRGKIIILYNNRTMNRPQRTLKPTQRLIEQDVQQPKRNTPKPAIRTLILDIPKVNVKDNVVDDVVNKPKVTKRKVKSGVQTTLHLDLSDVPPSDDRKYKKDWGLNPCWQTHFYTPNDSITKLYKEATEKLHDILPATFMLYDAEGAIGIANLELKDEFKKPIKESHY